MLHEQALKFLGKHVYAINHDTSVTHGVLVKVRSNFAVIRTSKNYKMVWVHLRHLYPAKT